MLNVLLPLLLLAAAGGLWKIGFQKLPILLGLASIVSAVGAIGFEKPLEAGLVVVLIGVVIFWTGLLSTILYWKWQTRSLDRQAEARKRQKSGS